ncbi:MAG: phosphoglyceromutase, partial [Spirosomaceae bacterium]|nr:phosphoglyceromutase [Spirosomataceae bacterium]
SFSVHSQKTENVFVIMTDGLRWQEVFSGADSVLLNDENYTENIDKTSAKFWDSSPRNRREKLMPFLWSEITADGQIYGNRNHGNYVDIKNPYGFRTLVTTKS